MADLSLADAQPGLLSAQTPYDKAVTADVAKNGPMDTAKAGSATPPARTGPTALGKAIADASFSGLVTPQIAQQADVPPEAVGLLNLVMKGESNGFNQLYREGHTFSDFSDHPSNLGWKGDYGPDGRHTSAAGGPQFEVATWNEAKNTLALPDFSEGSQVKAAWWLAQRDYKDRTGRDLDGDLKAGHLDQLVSGLKGTWPSLGKGSESDQTKYSNQAWGTTMADELRRQSQEEAKTLEGDRERYLAAAAKAPEGSAERMQMLHEAHEASRKATEQYDKLLKSPPVYQPTDAFAGFGGIVMALAAFAGRKSAQPLTASLNALSGAMDGMNQGNHEAFDRAYKIWDKQTTGALKLVDIQNTEIRNILEDQRLADQEKAANLQTAYAAFQMDHSAAALREGNWMKVWQLHESSERMSREAAQDAERIREFKANYDQRERQHSQSEQQTELFYNLESARSSGDPEKIKAAQQAITDYNETRGRKVGAANASQQLHDALISEWQSKPENQGKPVPPDQEVRAWTQAISRNPSGSLSPDTKKFLAKMYERGDMTVITSLPRSGTARIDLENQVTEDLKALPGGIDGGAAEIVMNRIRMAESRAAAATAGRITMQTGLYSREAAGAGALVLEASEAVPRTELPTVNRALTAYYTQTGDPKIIELGVRLNALYNAYGKLSNPTGTGIHDADKERIEKKLDEGLSKGQLRAAIDSVIKEGINVSTAAEKAQAEELAKMVPSGLPSQGGGGVRGMDFSKASIDDILKVIDDPSITNDQRRAIDTRLKELGH